MNKPTPSPFPPPPAGRPRRGTDEQAPENGAEDSPPVIRRYAGLLRRCGLALLIPLLLWSAGGCTLAKLREDVQVSKDSSLIFGEIIGPSPRQKPVVVVAYTGRDEGIVIGDYALLSEPGPYELLVREGRYRLFAFEDGNGNLAHDPGEWAGHYGAPAEVATQWGGVLWGIDIELADRPATPPPALANRLLAHSAGQRKPNTSAGALASLDDPALSAAEGERGFWAPLEAFRRWGCNIYFLEPRDGTKIPLLLVHGAAGSPQDWRYFISRIDRSRYQPWIFHYPSGARLETVSLLLRKKLYDLDRRYNLDRLYLVAHSMGGLVSRAALIEPDRHNRAVKLFVSLSTPWGGETLARTGVENSPAVIPSWKDMAPDSDFIGRVFARKLPETLRYYLLFGHRGGGSLFRQNNDNTVTLESMLDPRAQAEALKVIGFNEDHLGILNSADVVARYGAIVAATEAGPDKVLAPGHGYVEIGRHFLPADAKPPLQMAFVLIPARGDSPETQFKVNPLLPRQETGAVASGEYEASLCALGFKTEPANHPLSVPVGKISEAHFVMRPQGMVAGVIAATTAAEERYWGSIAPLPKGVKVRAIRLAGDDLERVLHPAEAMGEREALRTFLASRDYATQDQFAFFDLPAGTYTLSIEAEGCEPYSTTQEVRPGEFTPPPPFRLTVK